MEEQVHRPIRLRAVIQGRVQGVAFRHHTRRRASELGLTGYVRNRWDRTVEVVAEGQRDDLDQFLGFLQVGPPAATVLDVDFHWEPSTGQYDRFEVRF